MIKNNWQLNKIGLVNFWYYDDEEFEFNDGKMLLTGNNGAGKSLTMQSFIPFLLDGNKSPERLDPFRTRDKMMINYLIDEDSDIDERTAYLYMEMKRKNIDEYITIGIGLEGKKHRNINQWHFVLTKTRIGENFKLYKKYGQEKRTLSKKQLQNQIVGLGEVIDRQEDYIKKVNELFFGFEEIDEYKALLDLLIKIRSPKLSNEFKPTKMIEILNSSLQAIPEEHLREGADTIEQIDEYKRSLEELRVKIEACEKINKIFKKYNEEIILKKSKNYLNILDETNKIEKNIKLKEKNIFEYEKNIEELENTKRDLDIEKENLAVERRSLAKNDIFNLKEEKQVLENGKKEKEENLERKEENLLKKEKDLREKDDDLRNKKQDENIYFEKSNKILNEMENYIKDYNFIEFKLMRENAYKKDYDYDIHKKQIKNRLNIINSAKEIYEIFYKLKKNYDDNEKFLDNKKNELKYLEKEKNDYENQFIEIKEELKEKIYIWKENNEEFLINEEILKEIIEYIHRYDKKSDIFDLNNIIYKNYEKILNVLNDKKRNENFILKNLYDEYKILKNDLEILISQKEPILEKDDEILKSREELKKLNIPYIEFYKYYDFADDVEDINALEEALYNMGILGSIIVEKKYRDKVLNISSNDKYIFVEKLDENNKISFGDLGKFTFISEKGNYNLGILEGTISGTYKNKFIGAKKREEYRLFQIQKLENSIDLKNIEIDKIKKNIENLDNKIIILNNEKENFPKMEDLRISLNDLEKIYEKIENQIKEIELKENELKKLDENLKNKQREFFIYCNENDLPRKKEELEKLNLDFKEYNEEYNNLINICTKYHAIRESIYENSIILEDLEIDISNIKLDINKLEKEIKLKAKRIEDIIKELSSDDNKKIEERIDFIIKRLDEIEKLNEDNIISLTSYKTELNYIKKSLEEEKNDYNYLLEKLEFYKNILQREIDLGYYKKLNENDIIINAKNICKELKDNYYPKNLESKLIDVYRDNSIILNEYSITLNNILYDENNFGIDEKRYDIETKLKGNKYNFIILVEMLKSELNDINNLIEQKDEELFKDFIIKRLGRIISSKISLSKKWVKDINGIMEKMDSSSGIKFSLAWKNKKGETGEELDTNSLIELLEKDRDILKNEDLEKLSSHFHSKINLARRKNEAKENRENFYQIIKDVLDYRKWFEFSIRFERTGERIKELTDREFSRLSGGEKAMAMYIPLFSAAGAKYNSAGRNDLPRIIALDEAFAGIDNQNIEKLFGMMNKLDFNYILTSQALWGTYENVSSLGIHQLVRHKNSKFVTVIRYDWNGHHMEME